jgi:hypothetical protein
MKTFKILFVLCVIFAFSTHNANSQRTTGTQTVYQYFSPAQVPCLTEVVSGPITEYQSFANKTYHAKARGVLYGQTSGEAYDVSYEFNWVSDWPPPTSQHFTFPIVLKKDGKLVAEIHVALRFIINAKGEIIQDIYSYTSHCK